MHSVRHNGVDQNNHHLWDFELQRLLHEDMGFHLKNHATRSRRMRCHEISLDEISLHSDIRLRSIWSSFRERVVNNLRREAAMMTLKLSRGQGPPCSSGTRFLTTRLQVSRISSQWKTRHKRWNLKAFVLLNSFPPSIHLSHSTLGSHAYERDIKYFTKRSNNVCTAEHADDWFAADRTRPADTL